jgi:hypothetical protein
MNRNAVTILTMLRTRGCNPPLLYSPFKATKIFQSLNLTDAITDDSYSNEHLYSLTDTIREDSFG